MIWRPQMIVTWDWFDPAVTKKQMKSDLGSKGRKCQIEFTFPRSLSGRRCKWVNLSITSSFAHTEQKHTCTTVNSSSILTATTRSQCVWCVLMCVLAAVQVSLPSSQRWSLDTLCPSYASSYMVPFSLSSYVLRYMALFSILSCVRKEQMFEHHRVVLRLPTHIWLVDRRKWHKT